MSRKVIVASQLANKAVRVENFTGITWGDLKNNPLVSPLVSNDLEAVVNPGNVELRDDTSTLPEGDFKVYLIAKKNKAGMNPTEAKELGKAISEAIVAAAAKATSEDVTELKNKLVSEIEDFFGVSLEEHADDTELQHALNEAKNL